MAWGMAADVPLEQPLALVPAGTVGERWWDRAWVDLLLVVPAVAVAPGMLYRRSLKQYTAEVFVALLLLWLGSRVEAQWSPRRVVTLCLACVPAMLVSNTTVFVSAAVLGALALRELWRRDWLRLAWVLAGGAGVVAVEGLVYATFAAGGNNAGMRAFWAHAFVPLSAGPGRAAGFVVTASRLELARIGFGP